MSDIFSREKQSNKIIISEENALVEKLTQSYPLLTLQHIDVVVEYEKMSPTDDLESQCRRKLDELTARKAKILFSLPS